MSSTRTKEEQQLLDEKIARIQKKNEEILRRKKEIEEDIRLAEQQNAIVKLKSSTGSVSRERTPALKPSNRELREDFSEELPPNEPVVQRSTRGSFRGSAGQRFRGQGDWRTTGPPPDPKSFLYDDERDTPRKDRDGKGDLRREFDRGRRGDERDDYHGGREFQRGGRRGGGDHRMERGRRGGRGGSTRSEEDAWRAERMQIDEARIQRQRAADGKWRREWDNEKIMQEPEEQRYESRRQTNHEQWRPSNQHHNHAHSDTTPRHSHRGGPRVGRGRGRLNPVELELPLDNFQIDILDKQTSSLVKSSASFSDDAHRRQKNVNTSPVPLSPPHQDAFKVDPLRSIECVGNTVKISVPNLDLSQSTPKPQRQVNEHRGRFRSHTSYSSQSDDDSPRDRGQRGVRKQRNQKYQKNQFKNDSETKTASVADTFLVKPESLPTQSKPPLPPFRSEQKGIVVAEAQDGDGSWEDVTTSGTESLGEELSSVNSSPTKKTPPSTVVMSRRPLNDTNSEEISITGMTPGDFLSSFEHSNYVDGECLNQMIVDSEHFSTGVVGLDASLMLDEQMISLEKLQINPPGNTMSNDISDDVPSIDISSGSIAKEVDELLQNSRSSCNNLELCTNAERNLPIDKELSGTDDESSILQKSLKGSEIIDTNIEGNELKNKNCGEKVENEIRNQVVEENKLQSEIVFETKQESEETLSPTMIKEDCFSNAKLQDTKEVSSIVGDEINGGKEIFCHIENTGNKIIECVTSTDTEKLKENVEQTIPEKLLEKVEVKSIVGDEINAGKDVSCDIENTDNKIIECVTSTDIEKLKENSEQTILEKLPDKNSSEILVADEKDLISGGSNE